MFVVGEVSAPITADVNPFRNSLNNAQSMGNKFIGQISSSAQSFGNSLAGLGRGLTKYVTLPLAGAATAIFKFGKDFETEMSKVIGLVGVSASQVNAWGDDILEMAPRLGKAPKDLAEALFFVTSAGLRGAAALDVLEMSAKASTAGLGETKTIADLVTSAINAYGQENLSAARATDIITAAVREGKAEASELAASMGQVLPLASQMGVTFDQVAATQAAMTKTGTNAAEAATQLKSIMAGLIKPSKQAEEQLKAMGTSSSEMRKKIKDEGLLQALIDLREMTNKYGEEAMARVFPNIRALMGVLDLMGNSLEANKVTFDKVANSTGILDDAFKSASQTVDFKWNQAISQAKATAIKFFDVLKSALLPVLERVTKVIAWIGDKFASLSIKQQKLILLFGTLAGVIGPLFTILGTAIATLAGAIGSAVTGITLLTTIISTVGLPTVGAIAAGIAGVIIVIGEFIIAITAIVASFKKLYNSNEEFRNRITATWNNIKDVASEIFGEIQNVISFVLGKINEFWKKHGDTIMEYVAKIWNIVLDIVDLAINNIKDIIFIGTSLIQGDWEEAWEHIKDLTKRTFAFIVDKSVLFSNELTKIFVELLIELKNLISDKFDEIKTSILNKLNEIGEGIKNKFLEIKESINLKLLEISESMQNKFLKMKEDIMNFFNSMPENIKNSLISWKNTIVEWAIAQNEENKKQFGIWKDEIEKWFNSIPEKINKKINNWNKAIKTKFLEIKESIETKLKGWNDSIVKWFDSMPEKMDKKFKNWWKMVKKSFEDARKMIEEKLDGWWSSIKNWFANLHKKPEVKNAGKNLIKQVDKGTKEQKNDFMDKLGKLIVDVSTGALKLAGIALIATGREIIKRLLKGFSSTRMKQAGKNIVSDLIDGILSMYGDLTNVTYNMAKKIRDYFPFSPAKTGPLRDLDKLNFKGPIKKSLERADAYIKNTFMNDIKLGGIGGLEGNFAGAGNSNLLTGNEFNFYGVNDVDSFLTEIKETLQRSGGKF